MAPSAYPTWRSHPRAVRGERPAPGHCRGSRATRRSACGSAHPARAHPRAPVRTLHARAPPGAPRARPARRAGGARRRASRSWSRSAPVQLRARRRAIPVGAPATRLCARAPTPDRCQSSHRGTHGPSAPRAPRAGTTSARGARRLRSALSRSFANTGSEGRGLATLAGSDRGGPGVFCSTGAGGVRSGAGPGGFDGGPFVGAGSFGALETGLPGTGSLFGGEAPAPAPLTGRPPGATLRVSGSGGRCVSTSSRITVCWPIGSSNAVLPMMIVPTAPTPGAFPPPDGFLGGAELLAADPMT